MELDPKIETYFPRSTADTLRRVANAIRELDRLDAGLGASVPGHSIRDAAHGLRTLRDELTPYVSAEELQWATAPRIGGVK